MRQAIIVLAIVAVVFAILFGWRSWLNMAPPPAAPPPTQVVATVVTATEISDALEAVGSLGAVREVMLASEVAGRVSAIRFTEGAYVGKGATLVQLNDGPERADRAAAVARAEFARQQLARARKLVISGAESREMVQQRQSEYDQARAAISQLDARLVQKRIAAPFSGRLGIRRVNPGQFLDAGDEVATLTRSEQAVCRFFRAAAGSVEVEYRRRGDGEIGRPGRAANFRDGWPRSSRGFLKTAATSGCAPNWPIPIRRFAPACT